MPARLHYERVGQPNARRWLIMLHGILGSGGNWRTIARALTQRRSEWGVVLVDLRHHGKSDAGEPPHDLRACAGDVLALADELGTLDAIAGHSFGGKVALAAREYARPGLLQTWVFDASPSAASDNPIDPTPHSLNGSAAHPGAAGVIDPTPHSLNGSAAHPGAAGIISTQKPLYFVAQVVSTLERLPRHWGHRNDFIDEVVKAGHARQLAQWLAMNLIQDGQGYGFRIDLAVIREMLADYYRRDLWSVLRSPTLPGSVEIVIAQQSAIVTAEDRVRLETAPAHVHVHTLDAGHWLHIDAPDAVVDLLAHTLD